MRRRRMLASAVAAAVLTTASVPTVRAQSGINIGTLSCQMAGGWGWVIGSARPLLCSFDRYGAPPERYVGTMYKLGLDLGYTQGGALIWSVIAPSANLGPGTLAGSYARGTASAPVRWARPAAARAGQHPPSPLRSRGWARDRPQLSPGSGNRHGRGRGDGRRPG